MFGKDKYFHIYKKSLPREQKPQQNQQRKMVRNTQTFYAEYVKILINNIEDNVSKWIPCFRRDILIS